MWTRHKERAVDTHFLGFFYEPRGPVSYPAQFFFWEDLQNNYYLGPRTSPGFEAEMLASNA